MDLHCQESSGLRQSYKDPVSCVVLISIKVFNLKNAGWKILLLFSILAVKPSLAKTEPQKEVVSIYNDHFSTLSSGPQYFIKLYRCVKLEHSECQVPGSDYPVPKTTNKIEIVVPDVTNTSDKKKFYQYFVYNHTACECGNLTYRNSRLYEPIAENEVSEAYFKRKSLENPVNLVRLWDACNSAQPRYQLHPDSTFAFQPFKYLLYHQCLPVCLAVKKPSNISTRVTYTDEVVYVSLTSDISCKAYDGVKTQQGNNKFL